MWVQATFTNFRSEMKGLPRGELNGDDFLHEGVGYLPVAQVTVASDANKFHHNPHRPRHTGV